MLYNNGGKRIQLIPILTLKHIKTTELASIHIQNRKLVVNTPVKLSKGWSRLSSGYKQKVRTYSPDNDYNLDSIKIKSLPIAKSSLEFIEKGRPN